MHKWWMSILFFGAIVVGLTYSLTTTISKAAEAEKAKAEEAGGKVLNVVATNFQFDKPEYTVNKGDAVKVKLVSKEGKHAMEIAGLNVNLQGGQSKEVAFEKPGTYEIVCTLPCGDGHANMKSKLVVK